MSIPLWILVLLWWLALPVTTLVFYWAVMHVDKLEHQQLAHPWASRVARWLVLPVAWLHNASLANTWGVLLFAARPGYPGLTAFIAAMVRRGGWRGRRALWLRETFLDHYDRRGIHA